MYYAVNAFDKWHRILIEDGRDAAYQFCRQNFLSSSCLLEIRLLRRSFKRHLQMASLLPVASAVVSFNVDSDQEDEVDLEFQDSVMEVPASAYTREQLMFTLSSLCSGNSSDCKHCCRYLSSGKFVFKVYGRM